MTKTLHITGPADVIAVLPYELGYHPRDSLVVVALHGDRLGLRARVDLPPPPEADAAVASLLPPVLDSGAEEVLLLGYESTVGASLPMLDAMSAACVGAGLGVRARLMVRDGRWFNPDCDDPGCCPPEGLTVPAPEQVPAVAEFVAREKRPLIDRAALARSLCPDRPVLTRAVDLEADRWLERRGTAGRPQARQQDLVAELTAWSRVLGTSDGAPAVADLLPAELARVAVSLHDVHLRDGLITWLCPGMIGFDRADPGCAAPVRAALPPIPEQGDEFELAVAQQRLEARLLQLCRCLSPRWAVAPLTVLASFTWWRGDGALTRLALERALDDDPGYRLAELLLRMVDLSVRPDRASA